MTPPTPAIIQRYIAFLSRHRWAVAIGAFLLFLGALFLAHGLELRTDFTELLPANDPTIVALQEQYKHVPTPSTVVVVVEGPDPKANERFADALNGKLQPLLGKQLQSIDYRTDTDGKFYEHNKALFADLADLQRVEEDFEGFLLKKKNPAYVTLDDPEEDLRALQQEVKDRNKGENRYPNGYYEGEEGHRLLVMIMWTLSNGAGDADGVQVQSHVQQVIDELNPRSFGDLRVRITGDVATSIEEHDSLKNDLAAVSLLCVGLVLLVVILYFRSVFALTYIFLPTLLGVGVGFGLTELAIGYLNTNTAFLGPIILGNGINFGVMLLARYREERAANQPIEDALATAVARTWQPTLVTALATSAAYVSLSFMRFRGFSQFGFIGGTGMALCWLATYVHAPTLILLVERLRKARPQVAPRVAPRGGVSTAIARLILRFPVVMLGLGAVASVLAVLACAKIIANPFDYDMRKLRNQRSVKDGAGELYARAGRIFPSDISPVAVAILPDAADAPAYRKALLERDCHEGERYAQTKLSQDPGALDKECTRRATSGVSGELTGGMLQEAANVFQALPKDQDKKMALVRDIWKLLDDPAMQHLTPEQRKEIDEWAPARDVHVLTPADLPESLIRHFRERDGTIGHVVLIFPAPGRFEGWDGHELMRMADLLKGVELPSGAKVDATGFANIFAGMLRSIATDGPRASLYALLGVCLLVILALHRVRAIALVLGSLFIGVAWMIGATDAFGLKFNFLSFVAVPVTLGIGVDYAMNVYARLRLEPHERFAQALGQTGSAVVLCSLTTIIGYSSLLTADSGALRSLGKVANLGEVGCLLAALLVVPAVLSLGRRWSERKKQQQEGQATDRAA